MKQNYLIIICQSSDASNNHPMLGLMVMVRILYAELRAKIYSSSFNLLVLTKINRIHQGPQEQATYSMLQPTIYWS